jgi:outer membrane protein assembly factor BamB
MKLKLLLLLCLLPSLITAQELPEHTEEVKVEAGKPKTIVIDQPVDTVYAFLHDYYYLNLKTRKQLSKEMETVVTDVQTFTDKETFEEYRKEGKEFYNVYSFSIPARWKLTLTAVDKNQTAITLQLLSYYLDNADVNYKYASTYKKYKHIVSNNNLEGLIELHARERFASTPIVAATFTRENGFDNRSYRYNNFIPGSSFKEKGVWNEPVPQSNVQSLKEPSLIVYSKSTSTLFSLNEKSMVTNWKQQVPFLAGEQNHNEFTVYDHVVYLPTNNGSLSAVDGVTGKLYWQCSAKEYPKGQSAVFFGQKAPVFDNMVYLNDNKNIYAVNRFSGKIVWSQQHGGYGLYNYSADDKFIYKSGILETFQIGKQDGEVHKIINSTHSNTFYYPNLLLNKHQLILCDGDSYCYDLEKDKILWQKDFAYDHIARSSDSKNIYLVMSADKKVVAGVNAASGAISWQYPIPVTENEFADVLDFKLNKEQLCLLVRIKNNDNNKGSVYKVLVLNAAQGKVVHNKTLPAKAISNLVIDDQQIMLLTANGFTYLNRKDGVVSDKKYDVKDIMPTDDFSLNYVERVQ